MIGTMQIVLSGSSLSTVRSFVAIWRFGLVIAAMYEYSILGGRILFPKQTLQHLLV